MPSSLTVIGSHSTPDVGGAARGAGSDTDASQAGLRAELERLRKAHSECVNCASSKTREGQSNIQQLENRIAAIQTKLTQRQEASGSTVVSTRASPRERALLDVYA